MILEVDDGFDRWRVLEDASELGQEIVGCDNERSLGLIETVFNCFFAQIGVEGDERKGLLKAGLSG